MRVAHASEPCMGPRGRSKGLPKIICPQSVGNSQLYKVLGVGKGEHDFETLTPRDRQCRRCREAEFKYVCSLSNGADGRLGLAPVPRPY